MHEGCNARAFVHVTASRDDSFAPDNVFFITAPPKRFQIKSSVFNQYDVPRDLLDHVVVFEPIKPDPRGPELTEADIVDARSVAQTLLDGSLLSSQMLSALDQLLFSVPVGPESHLAGDTVTDSLRRAFERNHLPLPRDAIVSHTKGGPLWQIDAGARRYVVRRSDESLGVYLSNPIQAEFEDRAVQSLSESATRQLIQTLNYVIRQKDLAAHGTRGDLVWENRRAIDQHFAGAITPSNQARRIPVYVAHNEILLYTWEEDECWLDKGATSATLLDDPRIKNDSCLPPTGTAERLLNLNRGDIIILEEVKGPKTGSSSDADPQHRQAVRLTRVCQSTDPLNGRRVLHVQWHKDDVLRFPLCLSARSAAPGCEPVSNVSVVRGNIILCDHGAHVSGQIVGHGRRCVAADQLWFGVGRARVDSEQDTVFAGARRR